MVVIGIFYVMSIPHKEMMVKCYYKNSSTISTVTQQVMATLNKSNPNQATNTPKINAKAPEMGLWVA